MSDYATFTEGLNGMINSNGMFDYLFIISAQIHPNVDSQNAANHVSGNVQDVHKSFDATVANQTKRHRLTFQ